MRRRISRFAGAFVPLMLLLILLAVPASASPREVTRTDEWSGSGELPADALEVCTAEAADALARGGGWQYRLGRSVLKAGVLRSAYFYRYDDCAVVIATTRQRHGDGWLPLSRLVWVSTDPLDRARDGWRLVYGTTPGVRDPIRPTSPQLITVSSCADYARHPLPFPQGAQSNWYSGPAGTLYLDKAGVDADNRYRDGTTPVQADRQGADARSTLRAFQIGNIRYVPPVITGFSLFASRPPTVVDDTYVYPRFPEGTFSDLALGGGWRFVLVSTDCRTPPSP